MGRAPLMLRSSARSMTGSPTSSRHRFSDTIHDLVAAQQTAARREEHHEEPSARSLNPIPDPKQNRQSHHALSRIVITRMSAHPATRAYVQRRTAEGLSKKEIIRCLKRYVAREVYPYLRG
jgi:hypothetical protein